MSKLKIIDLNKQLKAKSQETVAKMEALQLSVQNHLSTLKHIEADLLRIAREEAEQRKLREQNEAEAQARAAEKAIEEAQANEQAKTKPEAVEKVVEKVEEEISTPIVVETEEKPQDTPPVRVAEEPATVPQEPFSRPAAQQNRPQQVQQNRPATSQNRPQQAPQNRPAASQNRPQQAPQNRPGTPQNRPGTPQNRPGTPQNRPGTPQNRPGTPQNRPGTPQSRPGTPQNRPGTPQSRPGTPQSRPGTPQSRPTADEGSGFVSVERKHGQNKKHHTGYNDTDRAKKPKRTVLKERGAVNDNDRYRGKRRSKMKPLSKPIAPIIIDKVVMTTNIISVKSLAEKTGKPVSEILKKLLLLGMMCTINSELDYDTAQLICSEFRITLEQKLEKTAEEVLLYEGDQKDAQDDLVTRPPIVTVMGHVDHGKTSLLDAIRETRVTEHEAGGITQHIGAYTIKHKGKDITFLDTPGHEAFTAMRARGAQVTDIAILVVAADDGVMPQTIEAINHAKAAGVPIIVAVNKIDKENANPEKIKQSLTEHGLVAEEWGGETIMAPVSAITKEGIDNLLEMVVLVAEVQELTANPNRLAKGTIVEAQLDKGRGPVATVLVQNGTLRVQDMIVAGTAYGRVRAMVDDMGNRVDVAYPSQPVEVVGFSEVPIAGDILHAVEQDKLTRQVAEERKDKQKANMLKNLSKVSLDDLFSQVAEGKMQDLNIVIKADVQGSVEAVRQALEKLENEEVRVKVIHAGVGAIKAMDVMLASASNALIIGFNVRPDTMARIESEKEKVEIRLYRVIYKAIEDIELAMKGMLAPEFEEVVLGHAEVRTTFKVSSVGTIAGSYVTDGKILKSATVRLLRDNIVIHEGPLASLKRFKDDAKEVNQGYECGITIKNYNDIKEGDIVEAFEMREIDR